MLKIFFNFFLISSVFILLGCSKGEKKEHTKKYFFVNQHNERLEVKSDFDNFVLQNKAFDSKNILVFFLDMTLPSCLEYMEVLQALQNHSNLEVIAISTSQTSQEEAQNFIKQYHIDFWIFLPKDSKNLLKDFAAKLHREEIDLPFLILYDKKGKRYQYYEGIVPQEMLMFDLKNI